MIAAEKVGNQQTKREGLYRTDLVAQCKELSRVQTWAVSNTSPAKKIKHTGPKRSSYGAPLLFLIAAALQWNVMRA